jgi:hypothetical protein
MASTPGDVAGALGAGFDYPAGEFRYEVGTDTWWWADEVYRMYGFEPGEVKPTTSMILSHKHPEDRARYAGALRSTSLHGTFLGSVHRILDAGGHERVLATIGEACLSDDGEITQIVGHFVDVTGSVRALASSEASRQIRAAGEHRAMIDQAMGALMQYTGRPADEVFDALREASMRANVKLRVLAQQIVDAALAGSTGPLETVALCADRLVTRTPRA